MLPSQTINKELPNLTPMMANFDLSKKSTQTQPPSMERIASIMMREDPLSHKTRRRSSRGDHKGSDTPKKHDPSSNEAINHHLFMVKTRRNQMRRDSSKSRITAKAKILSEQNHTQTEPQEPSKDSPKLPPHQIDAPSLTQTSTSSKLSSSFASRRKSRRATVQICEDSPTSEMATPSIKQSFHQFQPKHRSNDGRRKSCDVLFSSSGDDPKPSIQTRRRTGSPAARRLSPHPADMFDDHEAVKQKRKSSPDGSSGSTVSTLDNDRNGSPSGSSNDINHSATSGARNSLDVSSTELSFPNVTLSMDITAEQLHDLIESMQNEFDRLRCAKLQAEAKVEKLETDLASIQQDQQETKAEISTLTTEKERLAKKVAERELDLVKSSLKVEELEAENGSLKAQLKQTKTVNAHSLSKVTSVVSVLEKENRALKSQLSKLVSANEDTISKIATSINALEQENQSLKSANKTVVGALERENDALKSANEKVALKLTKAEEENRTIKRTMEIFMADRSEGRRSYNENESERRKGSSFRLANKFSGKFVKRLSEEPEGIPKHNPKRESCPTRRSSMSTEQTNEYDMSISSISSCVAPGGTSPGKGRLVASMNDVMEKNLPPPDRKRIKNQ